MSHQLPAHIKPTIPVKPFSVRITDSEIDDFKTLVRLSKLPPATYEGQHRKFGVTSEFMRGAKAKWENEFEWRATEAKINSLPQFTAQVDSTTEIHFVGVFSTDADAIPLVLLHGWPGSFYEYYSLVHELKKSTSPSFHIIVPSQPGYAFSSKPPVDRDYTIADAADAMDSLVVGLGLTNYVTVGGDIGALIARRLTSSKSCRGCHLNMFVPQGQHSEATDDLPAHELEALQRTKEWTENGCSYSTEHATRPSTIAHALSSSPLALLAWIGEKLLDWTDADPSTDEILETAALYWFTTTFPTSIYPYRDFTFSTTWDEDYAIVKPFGYSWFPHEIFQQPLSWTVAHPASGGNLIYSNTHDKGGHFPSLEAPVEFAVDIIAFVKALIEHEKKL